MSTPPSIHASIAISPANLRLGEAATLTVTATLTHTAPVTIFTWGTIFDTDLSLSQGYKCTDLTTNASVAVETRKKKRHAFRHDLGSPDEVYHRTLEPGKTTVFTGSFLLAQQCYNDSYKLTAGHRYRFEPRGQNVVSRWWNGRKEEVMSPPGQRAALQDDTGPPRSPIEMNSDIRFEFDVSGE